jgi:hypothetical protein
MHRPSGFNLLELACVNTDARDFPQLPGSRQPAGVLAVLYLALQPQAGVPGPAPLGRRLLRTDGSWTLSRDYPGEGTRAPLEGRGMGNCVVPSVCACR